LHSRASVGGVPGATGFRLVASSSSLFVAPTPPSSSKKSFVATGKSRSISRQRPSGSSTSSGSPAPAPSTRGPWRCAKRAGRPPGTVAAPSESGTSTLLPKTLRVVGVLCRGEEREIVVSGADRSGEVGKKDGRGRGRMPRITATVPPRDRGTGS
jgi:hypothetical protein